MKILPRLTTPQAMRRLRHLEDHIASGRPLAEAVDLSMSSAAPNATGGSPATTSDLAVWRTEVLEEVGPLEVRSKAESDKFGIAVGKAIERVISPGISDAAHDSVWSFLSLMVFPDLVGARWPSRPDGSLPASRWIGRQSSRDRNYLKLCWRRWTLLGTLLEETDKQLGEDEFGALLERSSLARNQRLIRMAAREVIRYAGDQPRTEYTRELLMLITYRTGPLMLDLLSDEELEHLVLLCAQTATERPRAPRRAAS